MSGPPPPQVGLRAGTLDLGLVSVIGIASATETMSPTLTANCGAAAQTFVAPVSIST